MMDKRIVALMLLLSLLPVASVCSAQLNNVGQVWVPPSWVWGNGYTPYYYPGGAFAYGFNPFIYYGQTGKTFNPYGDIFAYYNYQGKTYNPYPNYYRYPGTYLYPYGYYSYYWRY
jgi:hypothetical protein